MAITTNVAPLPLYPSTGARKSISPSQLAKITETIAASLAQTIALPSNKRDTPATRDFVSSYRARCHHPDTPGPRLGRDRLATLRQRQGHTARATLLLAEQLAQSAHPPDAATLIDLAVVYGPTNGKRVRALFASASLTDAVHAFTTLLGPAHSGGLYGLRKTAHILACVTRAAPAAFAHDEAFVLALARAYDAGLAALAGNYGGAAHVLQTLALGRAQDDWERLWLETKVALLDAFDALLRALLADLAGAQPGPALAAACERAFGIVFALLELPSSSASGSEVPPTPFLNRPLVADYEHAYGLAALLKDALKRADDARGDLLEATLRELDAGGADPGALKLLLRSGGIAGTPRAPSAARALSAPSAPSLPVAGPSYAVGDDVDMKMTQVLDVFPDQSPSYLRLLLQRPEFATAEAVIEALLEGRAPAEEDLEAPAAAPAIAAAPAVEWAFTRERRNVFDEDVMDVGMIRMGKKTDDADALLGDRAFKEQMKADILRRVEEMDLEEEEEEEEDADGAGAKGVRELAYVDEDDGGVKVAGDGEASGEGEDDAAEEMVNKVADGKGKGKEREGANLETVLELAYIQDPKVFERDGQTRRGKARADLRAQTGWSDEQIEGWRIMLERNPRKDKILAKHEFAGNRPREDDTPQGSDSEEDATDASARGGRGRGGGGGGRGGGGGGRGRGRGGRGGGAGGGGDTARDRAWKERHKNQNRRRGHDKKMARGGGTPA